MSAPDRRVEMSVSLADSGDVAEITAALDRTRVRVMIGDDVDPAGALAAMSLASMAFRVFGQVEVIGNCILTSNPWRIRQFATANQVLQIPRPTDRLPLRDLTVSVGGADPDARWHLGGGDWTALISREPVVVEHCVLGGLGLQAAAALTFGEILKWVLQPFGMACIEMSDPIAWNLLDGRASPAEAVRASLQRKPPAIALLGAGSIGSSAAAVLSMCPVSGMAHVVDPDVYEPARNAYRYVGIPPGSSGPKTQLVGEMLRSAGWQVDECVGTIAQWVGGRTQPGFDGLAIVSVDRVDGRLDAADLMARKTVSAGISGLALHAQVSDPTDELACSYCAFVDVAPPMTQVDVYSEMTALDVQRVRELLNGACLSDADVKTAVLNGRMTAAEAHGLVGGRIEDLLRRRYARAEVQIDEGRVAASISAPHVSWLAGVLLATEVVKESRDIPLLDRRVELDLSGVPIGGWRRPKRDPTGRCTCTNPIRRIMARQLYAA